MKTSSRENAPKNNLNNTSPIHDRRIAMFMEFGEIENALMDLGGLIDAIQVLHEDCDFDSRQAQMLGVITSIMFDRHKIAKAALTAAFEINQKEGV